MFLSLTVHTGGRWHETVSRSVSCYGSQSRIIFTSLVHTAREITRVIFWGNSRVAVKGCF